MTSNKLPLDALIDYSNSFYDDWTSYNYRYVVPTLCCSIGDTHSFEIHLAEYVFLDKFTCLADMFL
jgi:hypothetical protein